MKNSIGNIICHSAILLGIMFLCSCSSSKINDSNFLYFQKRDSSIGLQQVIQQSKERVIKVNDMLGIQVASQSLNQEQLVQFSALNGSANVSGQSNLVGIEGTVDIPVIGKVKAAGLTKSQFEAVLYSKLSAYVKDLSVKVRFLQFKVNILGEVKNPGVHNFEGDNATIIDAISAAGDLTDNGKRNDIMLVRQEGDENKFYHVNIGSADLFQSPVYQLQSGDIIYVAATDKKIRNLNRNEHEGQKSFSFFLTTISVLTTTAFIVITATK